MLCYNPVSSCWCAHLWFIFFFCLSINTTVVPTEEVRLISQRVMDYCCVYHGQLFIPVFLILTEPFSCVPGAINCNKEDLTIISNVTQYDANQSSDFLFSIWECDKFYRRVEKGNKERWYCQFCENKYNILNSIKLLILLTRSGVHSIFQRRDKIHPKYQRQFK